MNKAILIGRLVRDPDVRYTQGAEPMAVVRFAIAVDRPYSSRRNEEDKTADFLNCVCFGKRGESIGKYFQKGNKIALVGRIQTGEYTDQQGNKKYTTDIVVEDFEFVESKKNDSSQASDYYVESNVDDEELPF